MINDNPFLKQYYEMRPTSKWISVDEALPNYHERVLVVNTNPWSADPVRHISVATYFGKPYGTPAWSQRRNVTHWMRLPELPSI